MPYWPLRCLHEAALIRMYLETSAVWGAGLLLLLSNSEVQMQNQLFFPYFPYKPGKGYGHLAARLSRRLFLILWLLVCRTWGLTVFSWAFSKRSIFQSWAGAWGHHELGVPYQWSFCLPELNCRFFLIICLAKQDTWVFSRLESLERSFSRSWALLFFPWVASLSAFRPKLMDTSEMSQKRIFPCNCSSLIF